MKYTLKIYVTLCLVLLVQNVFASTTHLVDSLQADLKKQKPGTEAYFTTLINLADVESKNKAKRPYMERLLSESRQHKYERGIEIALTELIRGHINGNRLKLVNHYTRLTRSLLPKDKADYLCNYADLMIDLVPLSNGDSAYVNRTMREQKKEMHTENDKQNPYKLVKNYTMLGFAYLSQYMTEGRNNYASAYACLKKARDLVQKMPMELSILYREQLQSSICDCAQKESTNEGLAYAKLEEEKEKIPLYRGRPYRDKRAQFRSYGFLASAFDIGIDQCISYYNKMMSLRHTLDWNDEADRHLLYVYKLNHYIRTDNAPKALESIDSVIANVSSKYKDSKTRLELTRAVLLGENKRYEEGFMELYAYIQKTDSLQNAGQQKMQEEMQAQTDKSRLALENSQLNLKNEHDKRVLYMVAIVLLLIIISGFMFFNRRMYHLHTKLKQSYDELEKERQKAAEVEKMKSDFVQMIASEVEIPMSVVSELGQLLATGKVPEEDRLEIGKQMKISLSSLRSEINNMVQISKLDSSTGQFELDNIDVYGLSHQSVVRTRELSNKQNNIACLLKAGTRMPGNKFYFSLMMDCLLDNADKFTDNGQIAITSDTDERHNYIYVTDTGIGIPTDKQEMVFERFSKINPHTQGAGVGLYLCRLIARRMDGNIEIDSTHTGGTRVIITLRKTL